MASHSKDILVYIFQRGAADGLNAVVPYGDPEYYAKRPGIAIAAPDGMNDTINLDGFFALHPALLALKTIYDAGDLGLIHATGIPHGSRSHFSAQNLVERGVTNKDGAFSGWLGRHLALNSTPQESSFINVALSGNVPDSLNGADEPLAISDIGQFGFDQGIIDSGYLAILNNLYHSQAPFHATAQTALNAVAELADANPGAILPDNGAIYPAGQLGNKLKQVGQLIKSSLPVEVICLDSDGWDHHENLPNYIQQSLSELAGALSAFHTDMGTRMQNITVLVHTEFGRRVAENGSIGADHGTGSLAYVMGQGVNGGQVYHDWPGLSDQDLEMGEDLKITTDLRTVLAELLSTRLGGTDIGNVFPGFNYTPMGIFSAL